MFLGIEIGGTKLQLGVGDGADERFVVIERRAVERSRGANGILEQIVESARKLISDHAIERVGLGFGGPVQKNKAITSHHVQGWDGFDFGAWSLAAFNLPIAVDNDCNVAALAEATIGAGKGTRKCLYVTVGTGIGGGLVCDGIIYGQDRPAAIEIGHLRPGLHCVDASQTVESIASGSGIENQYALRLNLKMPAERVRGQEIAALADAGDEVAIEVLSEAFQTLGWAIAQVATVTSPEIIVVGGGVSLIGNPFFDSVRKSFREFLFPPLRDKVDIVPSGLGENVVVHGAIRLAADSAK